jgi:hypothetical protein
MKIPLRTENMMEYDKFMARHGEHGMQAIIERLERYEGIRANILLSLEERWAFLMRPELAQMQRMVA